AIHEALVHDRILEMPPSKGALADPGAAFVTLIVGSRLRGCVGRADRGLPLAETVVQCAIGAALRDERFAPLSENEMDALDIEISVLSELFSVAPQDIEVGRHGILVISGPSRGLLLPQVAVERNWTAERFLEETCRKAGLDTKSWLDSRTQ